LYTNRKGNRRIRVHTLQLPVSSSLSSIFRYTEIDAVTHILIRQAAQAVLAGIGNFKEKMTRACVDMLHSYRTNCASAACAGQLILPESLKVLPLNVGSIRKMPAFRSGSDIRADEKLAALINILWMPVALIASFVYPRVYTVVPMSERVGTGTGVGDNVHMPPSIACTVEKLVSDRVYLIDSGQLLRLYIRANVPSDTLIDVFGVSRAADVAEILDRHEDGMPDLGLRIMAVVWQIRRERSRLPWLPLQVVIPGSPEESRLLVSLCEDPVAGELGYLEFLCQIHKQVQSKTD